MLHPEPLHPETCLCRTCGWIGVPSTSACPECASRYLRAVHSMTVAEFTRESIDANDPRGVIRASP